MGNLFSRTQETVLDSEGPSDGRAILQESLRDEGHRTIRMCGEGDISSAMGIVDDLLTRLRRLPASKP